MLTMGSLFDGIGGFPLAAMRNGIYPLWASEIEAFPIKVTKLRFPNMMHFGDITKLDGKNLPPVDIICGGSPCQNLSVAGNREGLAGKCSGLFWEQTRITKEMRNSDEQRGKTTQLIRPRYLVWENVPGAFSSGNGEDFRSVIEEIVRIKYSTCDVPRPDTGSWKSAGAVILGVEFSLAWRVLDAQYWGVPQRRRRIFLVADFGGCTAPQILFKQDSLFGNIAQSESSWEGTAASIKECINETGRVYLSSTTDLIPNQNVNKMLCTQENRNQPLVVVTQPDNMDMLYETFCIAGNTIDRQPQNGGNGLGCQADVAYTLTATDQHAVFSCPCSDEFLANEMVATQCAHQNKDATYQICQPKIFGQSQFGNYAEGCTTLQTQGGDNGGGSENLIAMSVPHTRNLIRRLTPLECERLQGFPDGWTLIPGASDSMRYKALGNSVAIPCVKFVLKGIAYFLNEANETEEKQNYSVDV